MQNEPMEIISTESGILGKNGDYDICHKDILKIPSKKAEEFANLYCKPPYVFICIDGREHQISEQQFLRLKEWAIEEGIYQK